MKIRNILAAILLAPMLTAGIASADPKDPIPYTWEEPLRPGRAAQLAESYIKLANKHPGDIALREKAAILLLVAWKFEAKELKRRHDIAKIIIKLGKEIQRADSSLAAGHFWYAAGIMMWGLTRGVLNSLQLVPEAKAAMEKSIAIDPNYMYASGKLQLCRLYTLLPGFPLSLGDFKKALELCLEGQKGGPNFAMSNLYIADLYWAAGNKALALKELDKLKEMKPQSEYEYLVLEVAKDKAVEFRKFVADGKERDPYYDWIWMEMQPGLVD